MVEFSFLDWLWLVLFVILMIFCGVLFYRLGKRINHVGNNCSGFYTDIVFCFDSAPIPSFFKKHPLKQAKTYLDFLYN